MGVDIYLYTDRIYLCFYCHKYNVIDDFYLDDSYFLFVPIFFGKPDKL